MRARMAAVPAWTRSLPSPQAQTRTNYDHQWLPRIPRLIRSIQKFQNGLTPPNSTNCLRKGVFTSSGHWFDHIVFPSYFFIHGLERYLLDYICCLLRHNTCHNVNWIHTIIESIDFLCFPKSPPPCFFFLESSSHHQQCCTTWAEQEAYIISELETK